MFGTFHVLVAYGDLRSSSKILLFESILICSAETSGIVKRITALPCSINLQHIRIDFLRLKLGVISTAKTARNHGANKNFITKVILRDLFIQSW